MNNVVEPSFNENFAKKSTCGSREQCTRPTNFDANAAEVSIWIQRPHPHPAFHFFFFLEERFMFFQCVPCTVHGTHKLLFSAKLLLKIILQ